MVLPDAVWDGCEEKGVLTRSEKTECDQREPLVTTWHFPDPFLKEGKFFQGLYEALSDEVKCEQI